MCKKLQERRTVGQSDRAHPSILRTAFECMNQGTTELRQVSRGPRRDEIAINDDSTVFPLHAGVFHVVLDRTNAGRAFPHQDLCGNGYPSGVAYERDGLTRLVYLSS